MTAPRHTRRAFTLVETALAASIGATIVAVCLGIFVMLSRSDRMLEARAEQQADLQRLRLVMHRTFTNLVLSDAPRPTGEEDDADPTQPARPRAAARRAEAKGPPPPPRIILEADTRQPFAMSRTVNRNTEALVPQRLEVVLSESPVPTTRRDVFQLVRAGRAAASRRSDDRAPLEELGESAEDQADDERGATTADEAEQEAALAEDLSAPVKALRGAFQVMPQRAPRTQQVQPEAEVTQPTAWELWWVPLPPRREADSAADAEVTPVGRPYKVCSNIRALRWRMFDDRAFKTAHTAIWTSSLPAYIELQVETTAGLKAEWLFEVDWSVGPEVPKSTAEAADAQAAEGDKATDKEGDPTIPGKPTNPAPSKGDGTAGARIPIGQPS